MKSLYDCFVSSPFCANKYTSYFTSYETLLSELRNIPIVLLEIGVQDGGSLYMWKEYLHPDSKIVGWDLNPDIARLQDHGFGIIIGDQSNLSNWQAALHKYGPFDVIIDDGSHIYTHQIKSVLYSINCLKSKGLIIVEDTHKSFIRLYGGPTKYSFVNWTHFMANMLNFRSPTLSREKQFKLPIISITHFESIIAFKIDKTISYSSCQLVSNNKTKFLSAKDYTFASDNLLSSIFPSPLNFIFGLMLNLFAFHPSLQVRIKSKLMNLSASQYFKTSLF